MEGEPYDGGEEAIVPSSRICIKNVPKYVEEKRLREHFAAKGEVTDVKLLRTRDGQSRQMAFVGFKSEADAAAALKYFNNSYIDTFKLSVEFARKYGDTSIARPWSRHSEGSSAAARAKGPTGPVVVDGSAEEQSVRAKKGSKGGGAGENPEVADPRLAEFMALMAPRVKAKTWANDDMLPSGVEDHHKLQAAAHVAVKSSKEAAAALDSAGGIDDSDNEDEYQEIGGRGGAADGAAGRLGDESDDSSDGAADGGGDSGDDSEGEGGGAAAPAPARGDDAGVSDLDYLRSKVVHKWSDSDDEDGEGAVGTSGRGGAAAAAARGSQAGVGTSAPAATATKASARAPKAKAKPAPPPDGSDDDGGGDDGDEAEAEASEGGDAGEGEGGDGADADAGDGENSGWKAVMAAARGDAMDTDGGGGGGGGGGGVTVTAVDDVVATIADTGRLFVRNLAYTACEADLSELFGGFGDLGEVHLVLDRETKRSKGVAYILFAIPSDAVKAAEQLDMTIFQGRLLHILPAKAAPTRVPRDGDGAFGNPDGFKSEKDAARKADAGNRSAWSTLFMRADTVAEAVAAHYGVAKSELLDRTASDLPVRMALGEAQVVAQTKGALSDAGVDIAKLEAAAAVSGKAAQTAGAAVARSATTLLVKNLPYSADEGELEELFGRHGPVVRLVLPPTKTLALVEFGEPSDARSAFKAIAYKKYQHVPLYLEWAPKDIFSTPPPDKPKASAASSKKAAAALAKASAASKQPDAKAKEDPKAGGARGGAAAAADDGGDDGDGATVASIYVKNLAWGTADAGLRKHFDRAVSAAGGTLRSAKVAKKAGPDGAPLSMGFGFVEVDTEDIAKAVIKALQGSMLDKHKLSLQLSRAKAPASAGKDGSSKKRGAAGDDGSTKVVVRNVAFEATRKDIAALFSPFGHLKSCRLPKKFDGSHRGFGFVEFVTKQEAKNAMEGVGGTHLYGRRLVVEYAQEEGGLDELRLKTGAKFREDDELLGPGSGPSMKRLRKGL